MKPLWVLCYIMEFEAKFFNELTVSQLYEILKSRAEIFMLEQGIICQDMDGKDYDSLHCFITDKGRVVAYLRAFQNKESEKIATVGRVLTLVHKNGMGRYLMERSIDAIKTSFGCDKILVHAQKQAVGFYEKIGFRTISDEFLEEGVVHLTMELELN